MIEGEKDFGVKSKLILASVVGLWDYAMPIAKLALKYKEFVCGVDIGNDFRKNPKKSLRNEIRLNLFFSREL